MEKTQSKKEDPYFRTDKIDYPIIKKGWGWEYWIWNDDKYCGKILIVNPNKKCSLHFHVEKHETFFLVEGAIELSLIHKDGSEQNIQLYPGDAVEITQGLVHSFYNNGTGVARIVEFSTKHYDEDSFRVKKGD